MEASWPAPPATRRPVRRAPSVEGVRLGTLAAANAEAGVRVVWPGAEPVAARSTVRLSAEDVGLPVTLVFEDGDPARPIVTGVVLTEPVAPVPAKRPAPGITADGKRVVVEAAEEIVLSCGKASITLRADGEVQVRGVRIVSRAKAVNKLRGATVQIN